MGSAPEMQTVDVGVTYVDCKKYILIVLLKIPKLSHL
jgi:hypothetical protein